ncbi:MAG: SMC-Scp complex subunit ScpB [Patescibacteria group bacterium]
MNQLEITKQAELEALLFYYGEPIQLKKLASLLKIKEEECANLLNELDAALRENYSRGLTLVRGEKEVQLATKPAFQSIGQKLIEEEFKETLTPAALDTLSIIAYLGPLPRAKIDYLRGVNSSFTVRNLLMRGLVERDPNPAKGNIYEYRVSFDFLKHLGLSEREELPEYEKYKDVLKRFDLENSEQTEAKINLPQT